MLTDKGYDAEYVHVYIKKQLGAKAIIPVRKENRPAELFAGPLENTEVR